MDFVQHLDAPTLHLFHLLNRVQGVAIIENHHKKCNENKWDGYVLTYRDTNNSSGKNELIVCSGLIKRSYSDWVREINTTFTHEAVHIVQACKSNDGYLETIGGFVFRKNLEGEAQKLEHYPGTVSKLIKKYCL